MYKLLSRIICGRIEATLDEAQSEDQAGFRPGYSCDDHLFTITLLAEKCKEFNVPLWVATLDFKKAFDSIDQTSIWTALTDHGVSPAYINLLSKLYQGQRARVKCDMNSREFDIKKGTKQGDPVSPILFNAVLECVMRKVKAKWAMKMHGLQIGHIPESMITNLRFADDILLVGRTLPQIKQMIADVAAEGKKVGLELHPQKTKIQHNNIGYGSRVTSASVSGMLIEVLDPADGAMYLGRALCLTDTHDKELQHRLKKAWAKYAVYKHELTNKSVPLHFRLRLFHAAVKPMVLYGSGSWVMTSRRCGQLMSVQMRMLRAVLGRKRLTYPTGDVERWVSWVQRTTHEVRREMHLHGIPRWEDAQKTRLNGWYEKLLRMAPERWAKRAFSWDPIGFRQRGHPCSRWCEQLPIDVLS